MDALLCRRAMIAAGGGSPTPPTPGRLPSGYTEVEYIQNTTTAYIDTGIVPTCTWKIKAVANEQPSSVGIVLGTKTSSGHWVGATTNGYWGTGNTNYIAGYGNTNESELTVVVNGNSVVFSVGTASTKNASASSTINTSVWLFAASPTSTNTFPFLGKMIGDVVATRSGVEIFHGVCCISPNNEVGLYDLISSSFFGSSSEGTFTAGPTV